VSASPPDSCTAASTTSPSSIRQRLTTSVRRPTCVIRQPNEAWTGAEWAHDPLVIDDQALVVHVRGRGLVVLTGCGHAGAINIVRHAQRLTGVGQLYALIGGLHLGGPAFEPVIPPTVAALADLAPSLVVPGHCTGWRAQHALAAALPDAWVQGSSGTAYRLSAA
jgi:7,8-dihydropterin-6-yl-methyl-4-(beta-D-ribofuranosyl)aminobenzene 5'-phosphate synthase